MPSGSSMSVRSRLLSKAWGSGPMTLSYERGLTMTTDDGVAFAVEDRLPLPAGGGRPDGADDAADET